MSTMITVLHIIVCLFLMLTVLLQSGKGGGMGAAFGGGGNASTMFGGSGASNFLKRLTAIAGTVFMMTSMVLAFLSSRNSTDALDRFGAEQRKMSDEAEAAKARALKAAHDAGSGSGSAAGSASMNSIKPLNLGSGSAEEVPDMDGSDTGSDTGSAEAGSAGAPQSDTGSAAPAPAGNAAPATPIKPMTPAPTPAPAPTGNTTTPAPAPTSTTPPATGPPAAGSNK